MKEGIDYCNHCIKCHLHFSQWYSAGCDRGVCEHEKLEPKRKTKEEFLEEVAKEYKMELLRAKQKVLGSDIMDEFAVKLNAEPTYGERRFVERMWDMFEKAGAKFYE